ncbi:hypothetical protein, partial [Helicobacter trogontum]
MTKPKQCDTSMYKTLCVCSTEFERISIEKRNLGAIGTTISYALTIGGAYIPEKIQISTGNKILRQLPTAVITVNFGIISLLMKLLEEKSLERSTIEVGVETTATTFGSIGGKAIAQTSKLASSSATRLASSRVASNIAVKTGISLLTRIATGAATGAAVGSTAPIVGTIIGAIAGALIAGVINDVIFADEDEQLKKDKAHNAEIERLEKEYKLKIDRINDYLVRYHYIELRELTEAESEELCKEASNLKN